MIKVLVYDWVNAPEDTIIYEGSPEEVEIHLRSRFMAYTKGIPVGSLEKILETLSKTFGLHIEAWKRLV